MAMKALEDAIKKSAVKLPPAHRCPDSDQRSRQNLSMGTMEGGSI